MQPDSVRHRWVIDSIEEHSASIEIDAGVTINVPVSLLPPGAKQGDVLSVSFQLDVDSRKEALERSAATVKKGREMSKKLDPGGDISL